MSGQKKISYAEFGHSFIQQVVTARRIGSEIESVLTSTIEGSIRRLPADLIVISYVFKLRDITVDPALSRLPEISFTLSVLGDIRIDAEVFGVDLNFVLDVVIPVRIDVETYAPVTLKLVPHPVTARDIRIDLEGTNLTSEVLESLRVVQPIVRDQIQREVNARLDDPLITAASTIDVLAMVDKVMKKD